MKYLPVAVSKLVARQALKANKHAPEILFGAGVVSMVSSTVLACRATLKVDEVLDEAIEKRAKCDKVLREKPKEYSEKDRDNDYKIIRVQTAVKLLKLYAPSVVLGGTGIVCLAKSHDILAKRNAALVAAYVAVDEAFQKYRARVVEKEGAEADRNYRYGTREEQVQDPEDHRKHKTVTRVSLDQPSMYAKFFDPSSSNWNPSAELNLYFLKCQQNYANDLLKYRGHVFLNEIYDMLGMARTQAGSVVGWVLSPNGDTDNYIDFGIFNGDDERVRDFVNGYENAILLDFNVDGVIFDQIDTDPKTWRDRVSVEGGHH